MRVACEEGKLSERRACGLVSIARGSVRYERRQRDDRALRVDYNTARPHSSLEYQTPIEFAARLAPPPAPVVCSTPWSQTEVLDNQRTTLRPD